MIGILYAFIPNQITKSGSITGRGQERELQSAMTVAMSTKRK